MRTRKLPLDSLQIREIALAAMVSEITLVRALRPGYPVRALTRERIRRELANRGLAHILPVAGAR
jgi:hypothetical protein